MIYARYFTGLNLYRLHVRSVFDITIYIVCFCTDIYFICFRSMKDELAGEVPVAFVVRTKDSEITEDEIKKYVSQQVH